MALTTVTQWGGDAGGQGGNEKDLDDMMVAGGRGDSGGSGVPGRGMFGSGDGQGLASAMVGGGGGHGGGGSSGFGEVRVENLADGRSSADAPGGIGDDRAGGDPGGVGVAEDGAAGMRMC